MGVRLPTEVYFVTQNPPPSETVPYYGRRLNRLFQGKQGVTQFVHAHKSRGSTVWRASVQWEEVEWDA